MSGRFVHIVPLIALTACSEAQKSAPQETATTALATASNSAATSGSAKVAAPLASATSGSSASLEQARETEAKERKEVVDAFQNLAASANPLTGDGMTTGSDGVGGPHLKKLPEVRMGALSVDGHLAPEVVQRVVRQNFGRLRVCYDHGLKANAKLEAVLWASFTIQHDGSVTDVKWKGSTPNADFMNCLTQAFERMSFPAPESGVVEVKCPTAFTPGRDGSSPSKLGGTNLSDVRPNDVKAALEKDGCTDVVRKEIASGVTSRTVFTATKNGHRFTVTFVGSNDPPLPVDALSNLADVGVVKLEGGFVLAIQCEGDPDKSAARALLDALIVTS